MVYTWPHARCLIIIINFSQRRSWAFMAFQRRPPCKVLHVQGIRPTQQGSGSVLAVDFNFYHLGIHYQDIAQSIVLNTDEFHQLQSDYTDYVGDESNLPRAHP